MNNEPVVWIPKDHLKEMGKAGFRYTGVSYQEDKFYDIPLYTHPVKELTNEEILCLWDWWSGEVLATDIIDFADTYKRVLLGEKGLLEWHKEYVKKMNEKYPSGKVTEK